MEMTSRTDAEHMVTIGRVLRFVGSALDESLTPRQLADVAGFSPHHFHRIFRAVVGESMMDLVRRLRLERAAHRLKGGEEPIWTIALDAGYGSAEAFCRTFQASFGLPPTEYRRTSTSHEIPSPTGVHFAQGSLTPLRQIADTEMLAYEGLCEIHRRWPDLFEARAPTLMEMITGLSAFVYPTPPSTPLMIEATTEIDREIEALQKGVDDAKQRLSEARRRRPKEPVHDYLLKNAEGSASVFPRCSARRTNSSSSTTWAPAARPAPCGLTASAASPRTSWTVPRSWSVPPTGPRSCGASPRREDGASAPFPPTAPLFQDMGFWGDGPWPGVSTFRRQPDGSVVRIGRDVFDAGDAYCAA